MKCKKCNAENSQENLFCQNCGERFERCPVCGKPHKIKLVCPNEGKYIKEFSKKRWEDYKERCERKPTLIKNSIALIIGSIFSTLDFALYMILEDVSMITMPEKETIKVLSFLFLANLFAIGYLSYYLFNVDLAEKPEKEIKEKFAEKFPDDARWLE